MEIVSDVRVYGLDESVKASHYPMAVELDKLNSDVTQCVESLAQSRIGSGHDNFLNGIIVQFDLTATNKFYTQIQRYHFIDFVSSQSTMHRAERFDLSKQCSAYTDPAIISRCVELQRLIREAKTVEEAKEARLRLLYSLPSGLKLTARMTTNYRQLKTIYMQRRFHRLPEWQDFCAWIRTLPHAELIYGVEQAL